MKIKKATCQIIPVLVAFFSVRKPFLFVVFVHQHLQKSHQNAAISRFAIVYTSIPLTNHYTTEGSLTLYQTQPSNTI